LREVIEFWEKNQQPISSQCVEIRHERGRIF